MTANEQCTAMKEITEEQYAKIHPYLPVQRGNVRISNLVFINALLYIAENRCTWRELPERFGKWYTVHARMHRWARTGVLDRLFAELRELHLVDGGVEVLGLDSTSVKVHPDGTGAKKTGRRASANRAAGGSRRST